MNERELLKFIICFWLDVNRKGPDDCWEWQGCKNQGYGMVSIDNKPRKAHRIAYGLTHGSLPEGKFILHACDNRACCNPRHLRADTHAANMRDKVERGRSRGGGGPKLTREQVVEIRRLYSEGANGMEVAQRFGISYRNYTKIVRRENWRDV